MSTATKSKSKQPEAQPTATCSLQIGDGKGSEHMTIYGMDRESLTQAVFLYLHQERSLAIRRKGKLYVPTPAA